MVQLSFLVFSFLAAVGCANALYSPVPRGPQISADNHLDRRQSVPIPQNLTTAQLETVYAASCTAASSPQGLANLTADINNLTANSIAIQTAFENIAAELAVIDSEKLNGTLVFSPRWSEISQQWTNILWGSRDTATDTATQLGSFIDIIMPTVVAEMNITLAVEILQGFDGILQNLSVNAEITANNFVSLQTNLTTFALELSNFAAGQKISDDANILKLNAQITSLQTAVKTLTTTLIALGVSIGVTIGVTAGGSVAADALAFPLFSTGIIIAGAVAIVGQLAALIALSVELADDKGRIAGLQGQVNTLLAQEALIEQANSTLAVVQNTTIPTMVDQLNAFTNIWAIVHGDIEQSIGFLNDSIAEQNFPVPMIFWTTANQVPCVYEALIPALQNYADGIENSGIPPPSNVPGFTPAIVMDIAQHHLEVQALVKKSAVRRSLD